MKTGDVVKCDSWVHNGAIGVIIKVQQVPTCVGAYVILDTGVKLIRLDNLKLIQSADT